MKIGSPRLPAEFNASAYSRFISRLTEVFGLIDRTIGKVDDGSVHAARAVTGDTTVERNDSLLFVDSSATAVVTLRPAGEMQNKRLVVVNSGTGPVNLVADGSELINSTAQIVAAAQFDSVEVVSTGSGWIQL